MNQLPKRKRLRLEHYDYNQNGVYFVTFCVQNRMRILSDISVGSGDLDAPMVRLSGYGKIIEYNILRMNEIYNDIHVDHYVIMPDHVHLLIRIEKDDSNGASGSPLPTNNRLGAYIGTLKRFCNREIGKNIWQTGSYDHIIRNDTDLTECWNYIDGNPQAWIAKENV